MNISGNQLRGHLDTMVLSALGGGPAHGFEVIQRLEQAGCGLLKLKEGTLYPVLYRLEKAKLVKGEWEKEPTGRRGPRRRIYRLAPSGKRDLVSRREQWQEFVRVIGVIVEGHPHEL